MPHRPARTDPLRPVFHPGMGIDNPALRRSRRRAFVAGALALIALCGVVPAADAQPARLKKGFSELDYQSTDPATRRIALSRTREAGGSVVRLLFFWAGIEPTAPPSRAVSRDPEWSGYQWSQVDDIIRDVRASGLQPLVGFYGSPPWAEGPGRPPVSDSARNFTWKPSRAAFGDFARAVAQRYSGSTRDSGGNLLPKVRYWQAWNEPNLGLFLTPQWRRRGSSYRSVSPGLYRGLLNSFYKGVKSVSSKNFVVTAGTAPYGDDPGGARMRPAYFWRELLCVSGRSRLRAKEKCLGRPVRFDALAHHPYPSRNPSSPAINADDVSIPDLGKLTRPLKVATRAGYVSPKGSKQLWVTEVSYDSKPPDPNAFPIALHAQYLEATLYLLWKQGVDVVDWFLLRDRPGVPNGFDFTSQSGIFFRGDTPAQDTRKPAYTAFRFPFTAYRKNSRSVELWGMAPQEGKVVVERLSGQTWKGVRTLTAGANRVFVGSLKASAGTVLRARSGSDTTLSWTVAAERRQP